MAGSARVAAAFVAACAIPCAVFAQQGSLQVSTAVHAVTGDAARTGGESRFEPDAGISWYRPATLAGNLQVELRGTSRDDAFHLGRTYVGLLGVKARGLTWSFEGGDAFFTPGAGGYRFSNLAAPTVTFAGAALTARSPATDLSVVVGRTTAWINIFGSDPETLDQQIAIVRARHAVNSRVEWTTRASRIRSGEEIDFRTNVAASDQAGAGTRVTLVPQLQLVADGSAVWFRREAGSPVEQDWSGLFGAHVLLARGWAEANVTRFSPGELPIVNQPLSDRQTFFAAAEYDLTSRIRAFGGAEGFRTNLSPDESGAALPETDGARGFAGVRAAVGPRSTIAFRFENGDRRTRYVASTRTTASDSGNTSAEWQAGAGRFTTFARYARRENVERENADASYTQHDLSMQVFARVSESLQVFGSAIGTRNRAEAGSGSTFWQAGGGAQGQLGRRAVWLRTEFTTSRNLDLLTDARIPRDSILLGINGDIAPRLTLGLNVYADRLPAARAAADTWVTRTTVRLVRSFDMGAAVSHTGSLAMPAGLAGSGSIAGAIFRDWNANGVRDPEDDALEGIPVRVGDLAHATTARDGGFVFAGVPAGLQTVGLDTSALPVEFDLPPISEVQVELARGATERVRFGLVPLGAIHGQVIRDTNANGRQDPGEPSLDGAVLVIDAGARSEQVRKGRYRFDAVRAGAHTVSLLLDSLPEGAEIVGDAERPIVLDRTALEPEMGWLVTVRPRAEIRRVFPSADAPGGGPAALEPTASARVRASTGVPQRPAEFADQRAAYAVQIAALADGPRARALVRELVDAGYRSYVVSPPAGKNAQLYRVRVGPFATIEEAQRAATVLERVRGEKVRVVRDVRER